MIIKGLLTLIYNVFKVLTIPISIPTMPDGVKEVIALSIDYLGEGVAILSNYVDMNYLLSLFGIIIAVDIGMLVYKLVMWVIKKIPMLGIE